MLSVVAGLILAVRFVYSSPVDYDMTLAGNFGEPRPNHFHCGIDVKTGGMEGKRIFAISDGYVSRITVGLNGFGNALYITHPDGNTSVYCHLRSFTPRITRILRQWQYGHESYTADVRLGPLTCPVARGQWVAISGNTGASTAPHLHLELHDSKTGHILDPLDVLGFCIDDKMPPMAHAFMAYPIVGMGIFEGTQAKRSFGFPSHELSRRFTAWGKVAFGIWANDYMEATYNKYGVRQTTLTVDGREVFRSCVDGIPPKLNRQVNFWGDYAHYARYGVWYMRSFRTGGNSLPFIATDSSLGIVDFCEERDYHLEYELSDYFGNTSTYAFTVRGTRVPIPQAKSGYSPFMALCDRLSTLSCPGAWLALPRGAINENITLYPQTLPSPYSLSPAYTFGTHPVPLATYAELAIAVRKNVANPEKLYVESSDGRYFGGKYSDGWVTARIRELGVAYYLAYDDIPPKVVPVGRSGWNSTKVISYSVTDSGSGITDVKGYVDGDFVLFQPDKWGNGVVCRLEDTPLKKSERIHSIRVIATDKCGNISIANDSILY